MNGAAQTDLELVEHARRGVSAAIAELYKRYAADLFRLAFRMTSSTADAEDTLHDIFLGLPELLRRYEHQDRLLAWLRATTIRLIWTKMRRERRHDRQSGSWSEAENVAAPTPDPWGAMDLERSMSLLPDALRTVFVLRQLEDFTHDEIAKLLGITSGASRVRFLRALRRLRQLLEPGC